MNNLGKSLWNLSFMMDCVLVEGFCNSAADGEFTAWMSPHGSCVIDYFISSEDPFSVLCELRVGIVLMGDLAADRPAWWRWAYLGL